MFTLYVDSLAVDLNRWGQTLPLIQAHRVSSYLKTEPFPSLPVPKQGQQGRCLGKSDQWPLQSLSQLRA